MVGVLVSLEVTEWDAVLDKLGEEQRLGVTGTLGVVLPLQLAVRIPLLVVISEVDCVALEVGYWLCDCEASGVDAWLPVWLCEAVDD